MGGARPGQRRTEPHARPRRPHSPAPRLLFKLGARRGWTAGRRPVREGSWDRGGPRASPSPRGGTGGPRDLCAPGGSRERRRQRLGRAAGSSDPRLRNSRAPGTAPRKAGLGAATGSAPPPAPPGLRVRDEPAGEASGRGVVGASQWQLLGPCGGEGGDLGAEGGGSALCAVCKPNRADPKCVLQEPSQV